MAGRVQIHLHPLNARTHAELRGPFLPVLPQAWQPPLAVGGPDGEAPPPQLSGSCWLCSPSSWGRNVFPLRASRRVSRPGHLDPIRKLVDSMEDFNSSTPHPPLPFNSGPGCCEHRACQGSGCSHRWAWPSASSFGDSELRFLLWKHPSTLSCRSATPFFFFGLTFSPCFFFPCS